MWTLLNMAKHEKRIQQALGVYKADIWTIKLAVQSMTRAVLCVNSINPELNTAGT